MPALAPAPGIVRVVVEQKYGESTVANVLHANLNPPTTSAWSQAQVQAFAESVRACWITHILPQQHQSLTLTNVIVTDLTSDVGQVGQAAGTETGALGGGALAANVATCVSLKELRRYRGGHGRIYLCAGDGGSMENPTTWTGAYRAAIATAFKDFAEAVSADEANKGVNANLGILHRTRNGAPLSAPTLGAIVTITCDSRIDSQRRRLGRDRA